MKNFIYIFFSSMLKKIEHTIQTILGQFFYINAVELEHVLTMVFNPKECGIQWRSPGKGCVGRSHPHEKKCLTTFLLEKFPNSYLKKI